MKLATTLSLLGAATSSLAMIVVNDPGNPQIPLPTVVQPADLMVPEEVDAVLEERQATGQTLQEAATPPPTQYPSITTQWWESTIAEEPYTTYISEVYTQLFSEVPQQWPSAGVGQIGLGTLKEKREAMPMVTPPPVGLAESEEDVYPIVLQLETAYITQPLQIVTEIVILFTLTVSGNVTYTNTSGGGAATGISYGHFHNTASASLAGGSSHYPSSTGH